MSQRPIVLMHGIANSTFGMELMKKIIESEIPNSYVVNCEVGNGYSDSIFMIINKQIKEVNKCIQSDPKLKDGFIGLGFSQGGYLLRGYLEQYNNPPMKKLITLSSPLGGYFCGVKSTCAGIIIPDILNNLAVELVYSELGQQLVGALNYWRDPYHIDKYQKFSQSLAFLDNVNLLEKNETYKKNFCSLEQLVMFASPVDGAIFPWFSAWFGAYVDDDAQYRDFEERIEYELDTFGLKWLNEQGRVQRIKTNNKHNDNVDNAEFIRSQVVPHLKE